MGPSSPVLDESGANRVCQDVANDIGHCFFDTNNMIVKAPLPKVAKALLPRVGRDSALEPAYPGHHVTVALWRNKSMQVIGHHAPHQQRHRHNL